MILIPVRASSHTYTLRIFLQIFYSTETMVKAAGWSLAVAIELEFHL